MGYNELQVSEEQVWKPALTTQDIHTNLEQDKDDEEVKLEIIHYFRTPIPLERDFFVSMLVDISTFRVFFYYKHSSKFINVFF